MKYFKKIYIEITNQCNLTCDFCPPTNRKKERMGLDTFEIILNEIQPHTEYIYFHVRGEPLGHPYLEEFLDISYRKGFKVHITTNGTLIEDKRHLLATHPAIRQINFSLHSFDGNHRLGNEEEYITPILSFVKEAIVESKVIVSLRFWNHIQEIDKDSSKNLSLLQKIGKSFAVNLPYDTIFHSGEGFKLADRVYLNQEYQFKWPTLDEENTLDAEGFCYALRNQIAILVDGTVVPCCLDAEGVMDLGNLLSTPFLEILKGDRATAIFNGFSQRKIVENLCAGCDYRRRFSKVH